MLSPIFACMLLIPSIIPERCSSFLSSLAELISSSESSASAESSGISSSSRFSSSADGSTGSSCGLSASFGASSGKSSPSRFKASVIVSICLDKASISALSCFTSSMPAWTSSTFVASSSAPARTSSIFELRATFLSANS